MADFAATHYIVLFGGSETPDQLTWMGQSSQSNTTPVRDIGSDGILTEGEDTYISGYTFSGWYVQVDGENFGIFTNGSTYVIPYNSTETNLGDPIPPEITSLSTNLFDATLEGAANCFLTGTQIATPTGPRPIETLQPGDLVLTAGGAATAVVWVWQQAITNIFGVGEARMPIRVSAHALGPGCPARDLTVTADHALLVDGMLINAGALVNGATIRPVPLHQMPPRFSYWHIEATDHVVLLAEDCPAESFVDYTDRSGFDNHAAYLDRYGADRLIPEMPLVRISTPRLLPPALRTRLGIARVA